MIFSFDALKAITPLLFTTFFFGTWMINCLNRFYANKKGYDALLVILKMISVIEKYSNI